MTQFISTKTENNSLLITLEIEEMKDSEECYEIRDAMISAQKDAGIDNIAINMARVNFMGSIGILAFLGLRRSIDEQHGRIVFYNLSSQLKGVLQVCKLISNDPDWKSPFGFADSVESAQELLAS
ncbi:MAG: STAS domain-containing protein [Pirellulales bacterium]